MASKLANIEIGEISVAPKLGDIWCSGRATVSAGYTVEPSSACSAPEWKTSMAVGGEQRREERRRRVEATFPRSHVEAALDLLHLTDMAWHDCYGPKELALPDAVLDDVLLLADGGLVALIRIARQAVIDFRDVRVAADDLRRRDGTRQ